METKFERSVANKVIFLFMRGGPLFIGGKYVIITTYARILSLTPYVPYLLQN
jgi:hypothetical protein